MFFSNRHADSYRFKNYKVKQPLRHDQATRAHCKQVKYWTKYRKQLFSEIEQRTE